MPENKSIKIHYIIEMSDKKKNLLHVDDDRDLQNYVKTLLHDVINVSSAASLTEARMLLNDHQFNIVLLDLTLPDGSGMEMINELNTHLPSIPVIIFSAHDIVAPASPNVVKIFEKGHFSETNLIDAINRFAT